MAMAEAKQGESKPARPHVKLMVMFLPDNDNFYRFGFPKAEKATSYQMNDWVENKYYVAKTNIVKLRGLPAGCQIGMIDELGERFHAPITLFSDWDVGTELKVSFGGISGPVDCKCLLIDKVIMKRLIADHYAILDNQVSYTIDDEEMSD